MERIGPLGSGLPPDPTERPASPPRPAPEPVSSEPTPSTPPDTASGAPPLVGGSPATSVPGAQAPGGGISAERLRALADAVASGRFTIDPHKIASAILRALGGGRR